MIRCDAACVEGWGKHSTMVCALFIVVRACFNGVNLRTTHSDYVHVNYANSCFLVEGREHLRRTFLLIVEERASWS